MTPAAVIERCRAFGVTLHAEGERLKVKAPTPPPPDLLSELKAHKAELLRLLAPALPADMLEDLAERAAIIGENADAPDAWADAERNAVRLVQCRTCAHFTPDPLNSTAGMGGCVINAWPQSQGTPNRHNSGIGPPPWPMRPRRCHHWRVTT